MVGVLAIYLILLLSFVVLLIIGLLLLLLVILLLFLVLVFPPEGLSCAGECGDVLRPFDPRRDDTHDPRDLYYTCSECQRHSCYDCCFE